MGAFDRLLHIRRCERDGEKVPLSGSLMWPTTTTNTATKTNQQNGPINDGRDSPAQPGSFRFVFVVVVHEMREREKGGREREARRNCSLVIK